MNLPEFACYWAEEVGGSKKNLIQLRGGINNYVFRCDTEKRNFVIKGYRHKLTGQRDYMQAEIEFLRYAYLVAPSLVPELISIDVDRRCVVLECINGLSYSEGIAPTKKDIEASMELLRCLNANLNLARQMVQLDASDGFRSLRQHVENLHERIAAMQTEHLMNELKNKARVIIRILKESIEQVEERLEDQIKTGTVQDKLDPELVRVSPSDFGFHNAIRTENGVKFFDFEYAGWDDPAKTCIDFVLQPRVPVKLEGREILELLMKDKAKYLQARYNSLFPLLELKWVCIKLAALQPERLRRIAEITSDNNEQIIQMRLEKAEELLSRTINRTTILAK